MKIQFFIQYISFRKVIFGAFKVENREKYIAGYRISKSLLDSIYFDIEFKFFFDSLVNSDIDFLFDEKSYKERIKKIRDSIIEKIIEFSKNLNGEEAYEEYLIEI